MGIWPRHLPLAFLNQPKLLDLLIPCSERSGQHHENTFTINHVPIGGIVATGNEAPFCVEAWVWVWIKPHQFKLTKIIIRGVESLEGVKVIQVASFFFSNYISCDCAVAKRWPQPGHICMQLLAVKTEKKVHLGWKKQPNYMYTQLIHPWEIAIFSQMIRVIPNYRYRHTRMHIHTRPHTVNLL